MANIRLLFMTLALIDLIYALYEHTHILPYTRLQLATLYVQLGMIDDALMVLESDPNASKEEGAQEVDDEEEASLPGPATELMKKEQGEQVCADPVSDASKHQLSVTVL